MNNAQKLAALTKPKDVLDIESGILGSFVDLQKENHVQKKSFSPSRLSWSSGICARRNWFLFNGVTEKETVSAFAQDNMQNGTDSHERLQKSILSGPLDAECEVQLQSDDPPINSYCDVVVHYNGQDVPIEIKTSNDIAFEYRNAKQKASDYHIFQLLIYMKLLNSDLGFIMYENKNTYEKILIPVRMDAENREIIESAFEWMQKVYKAYEDQQMPMFFKNRRKNSKICNDCPVREHCEQAGQGEVDIPLLTKYERDKS